MKLLIPRKILQPIIICLCMLFHFFLFSFQIAKSNQNAPSEKLELNEANRLLLKKDTLQKNGNYKEAIKCTLAAQKIFEKYEQKKKYFETFLTLAELESYLSNHNHRIIYAEKALDYLKNHELEKEEICAAKALGQKADALIEMGKYQEAHQLLLRLIPILEKENLKEVLIGYRWSLALVNFRQKDFDLAKLEIKKTLDLIVSIKNKEYQTPLLNLLSVINYLEGDYQKAIQVTLKIIGIQEAIKNPTLEALEITADYYKNLGAYYTRKGEYERALDAYNKIENIFEFNNLKINQKYQQHFVSKSRILSRQERYQYAIQNLRKFVIDKNALVKEKKKQQVIINTYNEMAFNWKMLGVLDSAMIYADKAFAISYDYKKHYTFLGIGEVFLKKKNTLKGKDYIHKALKTYNSYNKKEDNFLISAYRSLGEMQALEKKYKKALLSIQKSITYNNLLFSDTSNIYKQPGLNGITDTKSFLQNLHLKAQYFSLLSQNLKDQKASFETYQLANQWIDSLQTSYVLEGSQLFWSKRFKEVYEGTIQQAHHLYQLTGESKYIDLAFETAEKSKALLLLEGLKDNTSQAIAGLPDSLIQKEKNLKLEVAFYEKSLRTATEKKQEKRIQLYQSYLADKRLALGNLKEQMEQDYPDYYQMKYANTTVSIAQLQNKMLDEQQAFIEYFIGGSTAFAFVISKNNRHFFPITSPQILAIQTDSLQQVLIRPADIERNAALAFQTFNQRAYNLYQSILDVALTRLSSSVNQLIISPDGVLNDFPFEVLNRSLVQESSIDFGQLPYLIKNYQIHYVYSANLWKNNQEKQQQLLPNTECLALAPPYKSNELIAQRGSLQQIRGANTQLEGTSREIQAIAQHFGGQFDWSGAANEANFKAQAQQYGLLHLAMHGEVTKDDARLIFTNVKSDTLEDNYLYPYEIANLDLQAQLAVLSACETGLGEYIQGEGVMSLARSFMSAGVPSLVMSLWKVNDLTTSELMPTFYEQLAHGQTKKAALHLAKKRYLQNADLEYRHPYYWSGFVLLGEATNLKTTPSKRWWYIGGGILFLLGILGFRKSRLN